MKGFIIAGTNSGCGKTTISLALMAYLIKSGYIVAPFKIGPDFIDPGHHKRITGKTSRNLDGWMLDKKYNINCFVEASNNADISVVEGVMGLFDGFDGKTDMGSTAQMAKWLDLPIILVVNAKSMARSAAAIVQGFENFDKKLKFAGVIFNNLGSKRHLEFLEDALINNVDMPCLGGIQRNIDIKIPERHLGLVTDDEYISFPNYNDTFSNLVNIIENNIDIAKLLKNLKKFQISIKKNNHVQKTNRNKIVSIRLGIARDKAFCFYYQDNLEILEQCGAELVFFSPIKDQKLPNNLSGIYFGGGYPELFAKELSQNQKLLKIIKEKSIDGMPIYGECGGFMYLCDSIKDMEGRKFSMTGCFPFQTSMLTQLKALGYREITLKQNSILGMLGDKIKGHEFHYSQIDKTKIDKTKIDKTKIDKTKIDKTKIDKTKIDKTKIDKTKTDKTKTDKNLIAIKEIYQVSHRKSISEVSEGYLINNTIGSYIHIHIGSNLNVSKTFIKNCKQYKVKRTNNLLL